MKPAMQWIAPFLAVTMLAGQAAAQLLCLPATEAGLCGAAVTSVALNTFNFEAAAICTINVGAGVLLEPLFLPTTTNGAIAESLVNPIVAIHTLPFVGSFQVSYPAAPLLGCPGNDGFLGLGATIVTCTQTCDATNIGTVQGEPHFVGFDGSRYDFQGTPNEHYSLLTDNEHSLNAQFVMRGQRLNEATSHWFDLPTLEDKATWLGAIGLTYKGDSAEVTRAADGQTIVEVNGKTLALGHSEVTASGLTVTYANATVEDGSLWVHPGPFMLPSVTMTTERYEFIVSIPQNHNRRLDLSSRVISAPDARIAPAEGVLGQTLAVLYGAGPLDSAFDQADVVEVWDPEENDHLHHSAKLEAFLSNNYRVSGLFTQDAARTNFQKQLEHATFQAQAVGDGSHHVELVREALEMDNEIAPRRRSLVEQEASMPLSVVAGVAKF